MFVQSKGIQIWVDVSGPEDGAVVLLLHGFPDSHALWSSQIGCLSSQGCRVLAPDLPGFGKSDRPDVLDQYKTENIVETMCAMLDELHISRKATLVGHDWGAAVAWQMAFTHPERVERLAVLSVGWLGTLFSANPAQRKLSWYMLLFVHPKAEEYLAANNWALARQLMADAKESEIEECIKVWEQPGALTSGLNVYRANVSMDMIAATQPQLPPAPLDIPVLGIWADKDSYLTEEGARNLQAVSVHIAFPALLQPF